MGICKLSAEYFKPTYIEYVYSLRNPLNNEIFYVGKTRCLNSRLKGHLGDCRKETEKYANSDKVAIIKSILKEGQQPIMRPIDETPVRTKFDEYLACYKEIKWIQFYNEIGWKLTNKQDIYTPLKNTEYMRHMEKVRLRDGVSKDVYYFGIDKNEDEIYDITRLESHGYSLPKPPKPVVEEEEIPFYDPWKNPRFLKMIEQEEKQGVHLDYTVYKDNDPNYYEQDDCFLFY